MKGAGGGAPHLEDVAVVLVDDQTAEDELGVEDEAAHREALARELLHRVVVRVRVGVRVRVRVRVRVSVELLLRVVVRTLW